MTEETRLFIAMVVALALAALAGTGCASDDRLPTARERAIHDCDDAYADLGAYADRHSVPEPGVNEVVMALAKRAEFLCGRAAYVRMGTRARP